MVTCLPRASKKGPGKRGGKKNARGRGWSRGRLQRGMEKNVPEPGRGAGKGKRFGAGARGADELLRVTLCRFPTKQFTERRCRGLKNRKKPKKGKKGKNGKDLGAQR